jgi:hypothetical protein
VAQDRTPYQQRIIRNYYRNLDAIRAQRLADLVGEIWLADTPRKRDRLWERARELLDRGGDAPPEVKEILERRDAEALARLAARE